MSPATRAKQADLAGSVGGGLLGAGLGTLLAPYLGSVAPGLVLLGIVLHGWGMLEKHRLEAGAAMPAWVRALYWGCWSALAGLAAWVLIAALKG